MPDSCSAEYDPLNQQKKEKEKKKRKKQQPDTHSGTGVKNKRRRRKNNNILTTNIYEKRLISKHKICLSKSQHAHIYIYCLQCYGCRWDICLPVGFKDGYICKLFLLM